MIALSGLGGLSWAKPCLKPLMIALKDKYISPFTDFDFKKLFGTEFNKDLLLDFLNELLRKATRNNQRRLLRIAI